MALEDIIDRIIKDAEAKAFEIKNKADSDAQEILSKAKSEAEALKKDILKENQRNKDAEIGRIMVKANLERKNRFLKARRSLIEESFKKAEEEFLNSDINILRDTFKRTILETSKGGMKEVIVSEGYRRIITEDFLKSIDSEMKLSVDSQKKDLFVLKGKNLEIDISISSALDTIKRDIESDIVKKLFG